MILKDLILIVIFFPGVYLLAKAGLQLGIHSIVNRLIQGYKGIHAGWTRRMIDSRFIDFPGIRLTTTIKSWASAELVTLSVIFAGVSQVATIKSALLVLPLAFLAGFGFLFLSMRSESSKTISMFQQDLPLAAFLMSLLMESGMGSSAAMKETVAALPSRGCAHELSDILKGRELGVSKRDLFDGSRKRVPIDEYRSFLNLIEQGERLGISLSQGLNDLSGRILEAQSHRAEMLAQQAAVKMLLPLVLFIFPAVFLIVLSPVILNLCSMAGW